MGNNLLRVAVLNALLLVSGLGFAQHAGALREGNWDLPRTEADRQVLNAVFNALDAVQVECVASLRASLGEEGMYAACGKYNANPDMAESDRARVGRINNYVVGQWMGPWQENAVFGVIRSYSLTRESGSYVIALNQRLGSIFVFRLID